MMGVYQIPHKGGKNSMNQFSDQWLIGTTATAEPLDRKIVKNQYLQRQFATRLFDTMHLKTARLK